MLTFSFRGEAVVHGLDSFEVYRGNTAAGEHYLQRVNEVCVSSVTVHYICDRFLTDLLSGFYQRSLQSPTKR